MKSCLATIRSTNRYIRFLYLTESLNHRCACLHKNLVQIDVFFLIFCKISHCPTTFFFQLFKVFLQTLHFLKKKRGVLSGICKPEMPWSSHWYLEVTSLKRSSNSVIDCQYHRQYHNRFGHLPHPLPHPLSTKLQGQTCMAPRYVAPDRH